MSDNDGGPVLHEPEEGVLDEDFRLGIDIRLPQGLDGQAISLSENAIEQMLGANEDHLLEAIGVYVLGVLGPKTLFGFENTDWKPFTMFDGTEVLVPGNFNITQDEKAGWLIGQWRTRSPRAEKTLTAESPTAWILSSSSIAMPCSDFRN